MSVIVCASQNNRNMSGSSAPQFAKNPHEVSSPYRCRHHGGSAECRATQASACRDSRGHNWLKLRVSQICFEEEPFPDCLPQSDMGARMKLRRRQRIGSFQSGAASPNRSAGISTKKVEPLPASLSTQMVPPSSIARFRQSGNPRPVPRYFSCSGFSTWLNSLKMVSWCAGAIPIPVSSTVNWTT